MCNKAVKSAAHYWRNRREFFPSIALSIVVSISGSSAAVSPQIMSGIGTNLRKASLITPKSALACRSIEISIGWLKEVDHEHYSRAPTSLRYAAMKELHPAQITVGMREVGQKRKLWRSDGKRKRAKLLGRHLVPVIFGPKDRYYIVDLHHLVRALYDEGMKYVLVTVLDNLSGLTAETFWSVLDNRSLIQPYDAEGHCQTYDAIPRSVRDLIDDPFRSLASELRRVGGFAKQTMPFSELLWADFLRRQIDRKLIERDFALAAERALKLAKAPAANYLPGWCGPIPEE